MQKKKIEPTIQISPELCQELIDLFESSVPEHWNSKEKGFEDMDFDLHAVRLDKYSDLRGRIEKQVIWHTGGSRLEHLRIHRQLPDQFLAEHVDNAYPERSGVIIRLNSGPSRFEIEGEQVEEQPGHGYLVPANTKHAVHKGDEVRYSLVGWLFE
jgi:hypothetical protein